MLGDARVPLRSDKRDSMSVSQGRRLCLLAAAWAPMFATLAARAEGDPLVLAEARLLELAAGSGGQLGVAALDTGSGRVIRHRADTRFPCCSTFKVLLAGAVLKRHAAEPGLLQQRIRYTRGDLVSYSPVSDKHVDSGMSVGELCAAALQYSDNTAANLLMRRLGGPQAVTDFARSLGDKDFRLDRWETELNTAMPGDPRDTTTPAAMAASLRALALGDALPPAQRSQLQAWLRGNTTGGKRIRAGVPADWAVGDKTGSGDYGTTNDVAVLWPPGRAPIVLALYFTQPRQDAAWRDDILAEAARLVAQGLA
jgi:beta-lactamase class A